jgi:hypothetical protein
LAKHGQHVRSLDLHGRGYDRWAASVDLQLPELPPSLTKLDSLQMEGMALQLQPGLGGVLRAGLPLTRLELSRCTLRGQVQELAAALAQLPDLQHLSVCDLLEETTAGVATMHIFPTDVLSQLTKLTSLKLEGVSGQTSSSDHSAALQPLQALARLADLQLGHGLRGSSGMQRYLITAGLLSGADQLTRLVLSNQLFQPHALGGKTQLQHLTLRDCCFVTWVVVGQLLSELQHLTLLTHLDLGGSCWWRGGLSGPPPAAYASLTAISNLQHLDFNSNFLPSAAWQYMCPPGRTLPQLRYLDISRVKEADGSFKLALPATSALVSCCPGLQSLMSSMPCSTAQLAPLQRLTGLHTLAVGAGQDELEGVQALCQLTGLQDLELRCGAAADASLMQLTQLKQVTRLVFPQLIPLQGRVLKALRCSSEVS